MEYDKHERIINGLRLRVGAGEPTIKDLEMLHSEANYLYEDYPDKLEQCIKITKYIKNWALPLFNSTEDEAFWKVYWKAVLFEAPHLFESYLYYIEKNRPIEKKFYRPRENTLKIVVQDLQDLEDRKIKFYGLSMPARSGKSTICILFLTWIMGKRPNSHNAMSGHSSILADGFYDEVMNIIHTNEYSFKEIFPNVKLESKSAEQKTINLNDPDRFATLTCRGIDGTWTGAVDISSDGYLYVDDLVRDRTESLSPIRLEKRYQDYLNVLVDRKNDGARELMVGTRWNVFDPLGRIEMEKSGDRMYRFRKIPALNEDGESNFDYKYNKGFSTGYYLDLKARLDPNEWMAKYQQRPFIREGLILPQDELRYYNGVLPEGDYRIVTAVDVAWGGGDATSMPIGREYENGDVYIFDWVFDRGDKDVTIPKVVGRIMGNDVKRVNFEANNGGEMYCKYVSDVLDTHHYRCSCSYTKAPGNMAKMDKIQASAPNIKRKFIFLDPELQKGEYKQAMDEIYITTSTGKNVHDDAIDSLAQLDRQLESSTLAKLEAIMRVV